MPRSTRPARANGEHGEACSEVPLSLCVSSPASGRTSSTSLPREWITEYLRFSLWERPRAARVRVAYQRRRSSSYGTLTPALSQRERENYLATSAAAQEGGNIQIVVGVREDRPG